MEWLHKLLDFYRACSGAAYYPVCTALQLLWHIEAARLRHLTLCTLAQRSICICSRKN